jgi:hypothetical protein
MKAVLAHQPAPEPLEVLAEKHHPVEVRRELLPL